MNRLSHADAVAICDARSMFEEHRWRLLGEAVDATPADGAIEEYGTHQGGVLGYLSLRFPDRTVFGFDRVEGCTKPSPQDGDTHIQEGSMGSDEPAVRGWLASIGAENASLCYLDLSVLTDAESGPVALAVVDTNLYQPTINALRMLSRSLVPGGIVLIDDVDYPGVKAALEECGMPWRQNGYMAVIRRDW